MAWLIHVLLTAGAILAALLGVGSLAIALKVKRRYTIFLFIGAATVFALVANGPSTS